jgi:hypothetical protein
MNSNVYYILAGLAILVALFSAIILPSYPIVVVVMYIASVVLVVKASLLRRF